MATSKGLDINTGLWLPARVRYQYRSMATSKGSDINKGLWLPGYGFGLRQAGRVRVSGYGLAGRV